MTTIRYDCGHEIDFDLAPKGDVKKDRCALCRGDIDGTKLSKDAWKRIRTWKKGSGDRGQGSELFEGGASSGKPGHAN